MFESFANTDDETEISSNDEISVSIESTYCDGRTDTGSITTPSSDITYARIFNKQERTDSDG